MADLKVVVDYSDLTGMIKTTDQSKRALSLMAQSFAKTGDQKAYMAGINQIVNAQKNLDAKSRLSRSAIMKLGNQMRQEAKFAQELAVATARASTHINAMGKSSNRAGVAMQQTGYQVGDFLVQVQSGTNPMVAFGQQATQLVGVLYLLPQATLAAKVGFMGLKVSMAAIIAVVSIAIPLITAFGAYWMRAKDAADKAKDSILSLADAQDALAGSTQSYKDKLAMLEFGVDTQAEAMVLKGILSTRKQIKTLNEEYRNSDSLSRKLAISEEVRELKIKLHGLREVAAENKKVRTEYETQAALQQSASELVRRNKQAELDNIKAIVAAFKAAEAKRKKARDDQEAANKAAEQELALLEQKNVLLQLEKDSTKDSSVYKQMALGYERDNLRAKLELEGVEEKIIEDILSQLSIQARITQEISDSADAAERLKNNLEIASSFRVGGDLGEFANVAGGLDAFGGAGSFKYGGSQKFKPEPESDQKAQKSDLQRLREQLQLEDALLGKTEARQRVIQALGVDFVKNNPKTVAGLEAQITANENLLRIEEERKRMNDLVTDSMENGLMAMADGTKTVSAAFRDMAREIIAELYRILVVQQMVNAAKSFFGFPFADGGAFSGGSQIQAYADGGVVGSPTLFPMAGGKTGLMGEAGPEAIMPLKRGANGKLGVQMEGGGGDNVVINQSFNFQANGDDSVKKIIAQAAPQIAQMTKNSMLNDRRRGGTTKAVFG